MYPNVENRIVETKPIKNVDYYENPSLTHWWANFDYKEKMERKAFLANLKH